MRYWEGRATGKSRLAYLLSKKVIPSDLLYKQGVKVTPVKGLRTKLGDVDLKIKNFKDLPGDPDFRRNWKQQMDGADIILYQLRIHDLMVNNDESVSQKIKSDARMISNTLNEFKNKKKPKFFVVGTHSDKDPNYPQKLSDEGAHYVADPNTHYGENLARYYRNFKEHPALETMRLEVGPYVGGYRVALGSLLTQESSEKLVIDVFGGIDND